MRILTFSFPLRLIPPSTSTDTEGTLFRASLTVPPLVVRSLPILYIFLSNRTSTVVVSATITTSSRDSIFNPRVIVPRFVSLLIFLLGKFSVLKEINSIDMS